MSGLTLALGAWLTVAELFAGAAVPGSTQAGQGSAGPAAVSEDQVQEAIAAIAQAKGYNELLLMIDKYKGVIVSQRARTLVDDRMRTAAPDDEYGRRLLQIMGQLFADATKESTDTAAARYLIRLIAMGAMTTGDSDQLQQLLLRYFEFSPKFTPALIGPALETPALGWPAALPRLMAEFVDEWHTIGAREASRSFADALHAAIDDPTGEKARMRDQSLIGQWYSTQKGVSAEPEDTNLILTTTGVARTYVSTGGPADFEALAAGRWTTENGTLSIKWDDGETTSARYLLLNGELVWPALGARFWQRR